MCKVRERGRPVRLGEQARSRRALQAAPVLPALLAHEPDPALHCQVLIRAVPAAQAGQVGGRGARAQQRQPGGGVHDARLRQPAAHLHVGAAAAVV